MKKTIEAEWLRTQTAGDYCSSSRRKIYDWIKKRGLKSVKIGGIRLIKKEWLDEFLEAHLEDGNKVKQVIDGTMAGFEKGGK